MKRVIFYKCPVCGRSSSNKPEIKECYRKHGIQAEEVIYCGICGHGWYVNAWGEKEAVRRAKECEKEHVEKGEADSEGIRAFFLSGGAHGRAKILKGGKDNEKQ